MANHLDFVIVPGPHGPVSIPSARSFKAGVCGDPTCPAIHLISKDRDGIPICETTFTVEQLVRVINDFNK